MTKLQHCQDAWPGVQGTRPCAPPPRVVRPTTTRSPWWPLFRPVPTLRHCYVLTSFGPRFGPWIFMFWASFAALFDVHASPSFSLDSTHTFTLKLGLNHTNLQSTLNKPKPSIIGENMHKLQINAN